MINNICNQFHAHAKMHPSVAVNFRKIFESELFGLSVKQVRLSTLDGCFSPLYSQIPALTQS